MNTPGVSGGEQLLGHRRPCAALDGGRRKGEVLGQRYAVGRTVGVEVLEGYQQRTASFGRRQHPSLKRREELCPLCVRSVQALIDHRGALRCLSSRLGMDGIGAPPVDSGGQS